MSLDELLGLPLELHQVRSLKLAPRCPSQPFLIHLPVFFKFRIIYISCAFQFHSKQVVSRLIVENKVKSKEDIVLLPREAVEKASNSSAIVADALLAEVSRPLLSTPVRSLQEVLHLLCNFVESVPHPLSLWMLVSLESLQVILFSTSS